MRTRCVALLCGVLLSCASEARAFEFDIHVAITREAIAAVLASLPADIRGMVSTSPVPPTGFSPTAIREIGNANKATDTGDCGRKDDPKVAASPCGAFDGLLGETLAAYRYLEKEPAEDHFDAEQIVASSNRLFERRMLIRQYLLQRNFIGARKVLGPALHAIQDFYSHSNYVELTYPSNALEERLGTAHDSFLVAGTKPRVADAAEPTCLQITPLLRDPQEFPIAQLPLADRQKIRAAYVDAVAQDGSAESLARLAMIDRTLTDPPLTSGFFFFPNDNAWNIPRMFFLTGNGDSTKFTNSGKCRHGWQAGVVQPGMNKDKPGRTGHVEARERAVRHSIRFIVDVMKDPELSKGSDRLACILGLMGYEPTEIIERVTVGVPGAPNGGQWDTVLGGLFSLNLKNIQPDVLVCMESRNMPGTCSAICEDTDWSNELNAYVCSQPFGPSGFGGLIEPDLRVLVRETDRGVPNQTIASFRVEDPRACDPYCTLQLDQERAIWISFQLRPVARYGGRRRPAPAMLSPRESVPEATPSHPGNAPATPSTPNSSFPPAGSPNAGGGAPAAAALRTPEGIDARLGLRDSDNCTGSDSFYPPSALDQTAIGRQLGPDQAARMYQMAAFALSISDTDVTRPLILNEIRARVGTDAFIDAMTAMLNSPTRLLSAYQDVAADIAFRVVAGGLDTVMQKPPSAIRPDVDRWILQRLQPALISRAVDLMASGPRPLTAECTLNQLAKEGLTETVLGR